MRWGANAGALGGDGEVGGAGERRAVQRGTGSWKTGGIERSAVSYRVMARSAPACFL